MAQTFPVSAQVIYDTLAADASLAALLGEYQFKSGLTAPAMSILTPGSDLPMLSGTTGVEVVIHDVGNVNRTDYLTGESEFDTLWPVFVICWKGATGANMHEVAKLICSHFVGSNALQTVAAADGVGALVQTKVQIRSDKPIIA